MTWGRLCARIWSRNPTPPFFHFLHGAVQAPQLTLAPSAALPGSPSPRQQLIAPQPPSHGCALWHRVTFELGAVPGCRGGPDAGLSICTSPRPPQCPHTALFLLPPFPLTTRRGAVKTSPQGTLSVPTGMEGCGADSPVAWQLSQGDSASSQGTCMELLGGWPGLSLPGPRRPSPSRPAPRRSIRPPGSPIVTSASPGSPTVTSASSRTCGMGSESGFLAHRQTSHS